MTLNSEQTLGKALTLSSWIPVCSACRPCGWNKRRIDHFCRESVNFENTPPSLPPVLPLMTHANPHLRGEERKETSLILWKVSLLFSTLLAYSTILHTAATLFFVLVFSPITSDQTLKTPPNVQPRNPSPMITFGNKLQDMLTTVADSARPHRNASTFVFEINSKGALINLNCWQHNTGQTGQTSYNISQLETHFMHFSLLGLSLCATFKKKRVMKLEEGGKEGICFA